MLSNGAGNRDNLEVRNNENPVNGNFFYLYILS